jgi:hypothetical protein
MQAFTGTGFDVGWCCCTALTERINKSFAAKAMRLEVAEKEPALRVSRN